MLRWPDSLRKAVVEAAKTNRRSMNAEIITRLESTFPGGLELTHGHLMPCGCGFGPPDVTWQSNGRAERHHVQCPCGEGVSDDTEAGAAARWSGMMRARLAGRVA